MNRKLKRMTLFAAVSAALLAVGCSTTRVLGDGEYRLKKNVVKVQGDRKFNSGELNPYIRQKSNTYLIFGWNPALNIYNWSGRDTEKGINKFLRKVGEAPVVYDPAMVDATVDNMKNHLEYIGYYGSDIDTRIDVRKRLVKVHYLVSLGRRYPICSMEYDIPEGGGFLEEFEADKRNMIVREGDFLAEDVLEKESERSSKYFRNLGYFGFDKTYYSFVADTISVPGKAMLKMSVGPSAGKYTLDKVTIAYPEGLKIRPSVLENLNTLRPGDQYSEKAANNSYTRLSSLRIFNSVNVQMTPSDTNKVDCAITMRHSKIQGVKVNLEASLNSTGLIGISPQLGYFHKNIFHGGEWLNLSFMGNFQFKPGSDVHSNEFGTSATLSFPHFLGLPDRLFRGTVLPRTDITASFNYQNRPEYRRRMISASYGYTGSHGGRFFYQVYPIQANIVRLYDIDEAFRESMSKDPFMQNAYQNHFDAGLGFNLYYTTDTDAVPKGSYHYIRLGTDLSGNVMNLFNRAMRTDESGSHLIWNIPYSQYFRTELQMGKTFVFGRKDGIGLAFRLLAGVGVAYGNSSVLPFEKLFYGGGANSLRGWQSRTVGPGNAQLNETFIIPNQTGDVKLEANMEFRFKLVGKLKGALFADAGNVWSIHEGAEESERFSFKTLPGSIAADWGAGLRLDLNFILIRVDLGLKVHDPARPEGARWLGPSSWVSRGGYAFHFGVGYPF